MNISDLQLAAAQRWVVTDVGSREVLEIIRVVRYNFHDAIHEASLRVLG